MTSRDQWRQIQAIIGTAQDGIPGANDEAALAAMKLAALAERSGGTTDGIHRCRASSFADPADVRAFQRCKQAGKSDLECFAVGDNGIGQFGAITAQDHTPMCALHKDDMIAKWGSVDAAAHKELRVTIGGKSVQCSVEDRMSAPGRIDLNPAAVKALGLTPPILTDCTWRWV